VVSVAVLPLSAARRAAALTCIKRESAMQRTATKGRASDAGFGGRTGSTGAPPHPAAAGQATDRRCRAPRNARTGRGRADSGGASGGAASLTPIERRPPHVTQPGRCPVPRTSRARTASVWHCMRCGVGRCAADRERGPPSAASPGAGPREPRGASDPEAGGAAAPMRRRGPMGSSAKAREAVKQRDAPTIRSIPPRAGNRHRPANAGESLPAAMPQSGPV
jgi:hypothetical protein